MTLGIRRHSLLHPLKATPLLKFVNHGELYNPYEDILTDKTQFIAFVEQRIFPVQFALTVV